MSVSVDTCWICGDSGTTGEHKIKLSDLRAAFSNPTQATPLYFHDGKVKNVPIGSLKTGRLKSPSRICANCNNTRTQPHDRAWERMSESLRTRNPAIKPGTIVRANRIFPCDTARQMRNVHLFFVKLFGCHIVEASIPIDVTAFARSILAEKANPSVYLKWRCGPSFAGKPMTGMSNVDAAIRTSDGLCAFATWLYCVDGLAVEVMFAADGEKRQGLVDAWHPRFGTNKLLIANSPVTDTSS